MTFYKKKLIFKLIETPVFSTWTSRVQCQEKRISQFQNPLARLEARCSASINGISLCGLGGQKLYNGENAAFWVKCGPILELLRTWVIIFIKIRKFFKIIVHDSSFHALVVLLVSRASPKHSLHPASCFPAQLLVCYLQLCNQALIWGICGLSSEMRPKCGPFPQFRILRVESNLGNKVMDGTLHLLRRHLNQHHDTPRSSMDCNYTLKLQHGW